MEREIFLLKIKAVCVPNGSQIVSFREIIDLQNLKSGSHFTIATRFIQTLQCWLHVFQLLLRSFFHKTNANKLTKTSQKYEVIVIVLESNHQVNKQTLHHQSVNQMVI